MRESCASSEGRKALINGAASSRRMASHTSAMDLRTVFFNSVDSLALRCVPHLFLGCLRYTLHDFDVPVRRAR